MQFPRPPAGALVTRRAGKPWCQLRAALHVCAKQIDQPEELTAICSNRHSRDLSAHVPPLKRFDMCFEAIEPCELAPVVEMPRGESANPVLFIQALNLHRVPSTPGFSAMCLGWSQIPYTTPTCSDHLPSKMRVSEAAAAGGGGDWRSYRDSLDRLLSVGPLQQAAIPLMGGCPRRGALYRCAPHPSAACVYVGPPNTSRPSPFQGSGRSPGSHNALKASVGPV